jgi:hypothetical protein
MFTEPTRTVLCFAYGGFSVDLSLIGFVGMKYPLMSGCWILVSLFLMCTNLSNVCLVTWYQWRNFFTSYVASVSSVRGNRVSWLGMSSCCFILKRFLTCRFHFSFRFGVCSHFGTSRVSKNNFIRCVSVSMSIFWDVLISCLCCLCLPLQFASSGMLGGL